VGGNGLIVATEDPSPEKAADWTVRSESHWAPYFCAVAEGWAGSFRRALVGGNFGELRVSSNGFDSMTNLTIGGGLDEIDDFAVSTLETARFVAVGSAGTLLTSPDGISWTRRTSPTTRDLHSVTRFNPSSADPAVFLAVGDNGTILSSENGADWTEKTSPTSKDLHAIAAGRVVNASKIVPCVVVVGEDGTIFYSYNTRTWTEADIPATTETLLGVAGLSSGFVAVGEHGAIVASSNARFWSERESHTLRRLNDVAWTGSQAVAVGQYGVILTSPNTISWTSRHSPASACDATLKAVARLDSGRLVAVGSGGTILVSDPSIDFRDWLAAQSPPPGQDGPEDDPNADGICNLVSCALGIPAVGYGSDGHSDPLPRLAPANPGDAMVVSMRPVHELGDVSYVLEVSESLDADDWTEVFRHMPGAPCGTGQATMRRSASNSRVFFVLPDSVGTHPRQFVRMRAELAP
jgi:photosystem II stability/assembly factor-like uncharacterized protein